MSTSRSTDRSGDLPQHHNLGLLRATCLFDIVCDLSNAFEHENLWSIVGGKFQRVIDYQRLDTAFYDAEKRLASRSWIADNGVSTVQADGPADWANDVLRSSESFILRHAKTGSDINALDVRVGTRGHNYGAMRFLSPRRFDSHDAQVACECSSHLALALLRIRSLEEQLEQQRLSQSAQRNLEAQVADLKECQETLRRASSALHEFTYVAGHDLQEPLRMVSIYTELLLTHKNLTDTEAARFAAVIRSGVVRMGDLIKDLVLYSRVIRDRGITQSVNLNEPLESALQALDQQLREAGAEVRHTALPVVTADPRHLSVVFENLLANALKYRRPNVTPIIDIAASRCGDEWLVTITDNGIGFSPLHEERIFGLFKRLHRDAYPGTGLGLAICRTIVEQYGGTITAHSRRRRAWRNIHARFSPRWLALSANLRGY